jgi:hypothetical protein
MLLASRSHCRAAWLPTLAAACVLAVLAAAPNAHAESYRNHGSVRAEDRAVVLVLPTATRETKAFEWRIRGANGGSWSRPRRALRVADEVRVNRLLNGKTYVLSYRRVRWASGPGRWSRSLRATPFAATLAGPIVQAQSTSDQSAPPEPTTPTGPTGPPAPTGPTGPQPPPATNLPTISIDTTDAAPIVSKDDYLTADYAITGAPDAAQDITGTTEIKGRGNTTWDYPKKPYKLKLTAKKPLLGMPSNKHWVLLADYADPSKIRNSIAMFFSGKTALAWTPRHRYVRLNLNGAYAGLYELFEHIRVDPDRVAITAMKPTDTSGNDLTGGYLVEHDVRGPDTEEAGFTTSRGVDYNVLDPEAPTPEQLTYISNYYQELEDVTLGPGFANPATGYAKYIDIDSWIDWYIVEEIVKSHDAGAASVYSYKPRGGKLFKGPVWDFDFSIETPGTHATPGYTGWFVRNINGYYRRLFEDPAFTAKLAARWSVLRPQLETVHQEIATWQTSLADAVAEDAWMWWKPQSFADQTQFIDSWLTGRMNWIDQEVTE